MHLIDSMILEILSIFFNSNSMTSMPQSSMTSDFLQQSDYISLFFYSIIYQENFILINLLHCYQFQNVLLIARIQMICKLFFKLERSTTIYSTINCTYLDESILQSLQIVSNRYRLFNIFYGVYRVSKCAINQLLKYLFIYKKIIYKLYNTI